MVSDIFIVGGGVCGLASALAISKALSSSPQDVKITVFELRDEPTTFGGAVNLTPSAQRHLDHIGVLKVLREKNFGAEVDAIELFSLHSGARLGSLDFAGEDGAGHGGYKGRRIMRYDLLLALIDAAKRVPNVELVHGKKVLNVEESGSGEKVTVSFEDGTNGTADLVLGCDGIHSNTRMRFVEPERVPTYTGISTAQAFVKTEEVNSEIHFRDTAVNMSRSGSLLTTYCGPQRDEIYLAAVMEVKDALSRDGWKAKEADRDAVRQNIMARFGDPAYPGIREMVAGTGNWFLYPVHALENGGKWCRDRVILLGDAAHAMPPQGESIGFALEDAILFARVLEKFSVKRLQDVFHVYQHLRRPRIEDSHREASRRWETARDSGYLVNKLKELFVWGWFWWTKDSRKEAYLFNAEEVDIPDS